MVDLYFVFFKGNVSFTYCPHVIIYLPVIIELYLTSKSLRYDSQLFNFP